MGKVRKIKKKLKTSKLVAASLLAAIGKRGARGGSNKQSASGPNGKDGDTGTYGVVPSEYNIQAQIDWLTAPPSVASDKKNSTTQSNPPPSKKPQRGFHRDACEACGESDYLMYCDKCPAAFHAICDDPPLPFEDYETIGINWKCKKCRCAAEQDNGCQKSGGNSTSNAGGPVGKFFQTCLPQIKTQNPTTFRLSKELPAYDYPFPGTSRHILKKGRSRTSVVDVENGMVPRPTVLCYHCHRSCRTGALIQCDKCDLFYHLDCLDPPLTTIPATVWMCPLHVEPYLESTQLTTIALSERIKIWDSTEKPVNRGAVIVDFLRKTSRRNPMFRRKKLIPMTLSPEVPEMVQNCYKDDAMYVHERFGKLQTLAAACEVERLKVEMEENVTKYKNRWIDHYLPLGKSLVEQRAKLEYLRSRNDSKIEHIRHVIKTYDELEEQRALKARQDSVPESSPQKAKLSHMLDDLPKDGESDTGESETPICVVSSVSGTINPPQKIIKESESKPNVPTDSDVISKTEVLTEQCEQSTSSATTICNKGLTDGHEELENIAKWVWDEVKAADADAEEDLKAVNELSKDVRRVGEMLLNFPLTDEFCNSLANKNVVEEVRAPPASIPIVPPITTQPILPLSAELENKPKPFLYVPKEHVGLQLDVVKNLPKKTVQRLAACHLRNIRRKREMKEYIQSEKVAHSNIPAVNLPGPRPLISFYIENLCVNVEMTKRSFWIGSGDSCDWKITDFVKCNRIDRKHAKMFYNPHEDCWEILNYSANGIYVNNTLFGFKSEDAYVAPSNSTLEKIHEIHELGLKKVDEFIKNHNSELYGLDMTPCFCKPFPSKGMPNVFEGSAKVYAGNKLQIGCAKLTVEGVFTTN